LLGGCSGGGGGGNGTVGVAPMLESVTVSPSSAAAGLSLTLSGEFTFSDADGDLAGGSFNYTYEATYSFPLPAELAGLTGATVQFLVDVVLSTSTGELSIPCWLVDSGGRQSNTVTLSITQLWTRQFGTLLEDIGYGIAVDANDNVIVTGKTSGDLHGQSNQGLADVFITRYGSDTVRQWTRLIGSGSDDNGRAVAVDSGNNLYVTGDTSGTAFDGMTTDGLLDGFLTRFSAGGTRQWTVIIGESGTVDQPNAIAVDGSDNIYLAGESESGLDGEVNTGLQDAFLSKYDVNGNLAWTRLLGTAGSDFAYAVTTDAAGNIYLAGGTDGVLGTDPSPGDPMTNFDAFVAKYDAGGTLQWVSQIGTACGEWARGIAVDSSGAVSIAGRIYQCAFSGNTASGGYDAFVARLEANGSLQWVRQFGTANHDSGNAVTVDGSGNLIVTGYLDSVYFSDDNEGNTLFLARYDSAGKRQWLTEEDAGTSWGNQGMTVAQDSVGNLFVSGTTQGQLDGHSNPDFGEDDVFILKFDSTGIKR
jgi:hypothetical protein